MPRNSKKKRNQRSDTENVANTWSKGPVPSKAKSVIFDNNRYIITNNLLRNFVVRDVVPINSSLDKYYGNKLEEIDELYSETAFLFFLAGKSDEYTNPEFHPVLIGLLNNALNTFGGAVILLRNGLPSQSMLLVRQVIEICSTIIHICVDPKNEAFQNFIDGNYKSSKSITETKKSVAIIGYLWGFLSTSFVHINRTHSEIQPVKEFKPDDTDVNAVIACLRMAVWISYLTAEIAFPAVKKENRYWKRRIINGRTALEYSPSDDEAEWAAKFLDLEEVGPEDVGSTNA